MDPKIVGVTGVAGVGKSTALASISDTFSYQLIRASQAIAIRMGDDPDRLGIGEELRIGDILDNQRQLVEGFKALRNPTKSCVLFDCHTIIDTDLGLEEIPSSVFSTIGIHALLVLIDNPDEIVKRRDNDAVRSRPYRTAEQLQAYQDKVIERSAGVALDLGITLTVLPFQKIIEIDAVLSSVVKAI